MRLPPAGLLALALAATALSGCADDSPRDDPVVPETPVTHVLEDALAAYLAGNATSNLERLAQFGGGSAELDAWGDLVFVDAGATVDIYDVSDPLSPQEVSSVTGLPGILDVKVSDDGNWLFVGEDAEASMELPTGQTTATGGFYVVDIADKSNPRLVSSLAVGPRRGPHMVFYHQTAGGDELVFGANADISINRFDRASGTLTELSRYQAPLTDFQRTPDTFDVLYQGWAHDIFVMEDPVENRTLMYVANWDAGVRIVDLTDPANPVELGAWNDFPAGHSGNLHTVATEWIGDRRITVGSVEVGFAVVGGVPYALHQEKGIVYVWDTTDPANIQLLGTWENPNHIPIERDMIEGVETSTHNFQLEGGVIYLAHYAMGVFVLDIRTPDLQRAPGLLAFHEEPENTVWDVILVDGIMYSSGNAGVISLHYLPDAVGETGIDSRA